MAYETFPTTVPGPSYPIDRRAEPKVKKVDFGDGYTQEYPDGLNYNMYEWSLSWEALTETEKNTIDAFLVARKGCETFLWTDPSGTSFKVKARSWSVAEFAPKVFSIKATFKQVAI